MLNEKERQVIKLMAAGATVEQIAAHMKTSASAIRRILAAAIRKARVNNQYELMKYAHDEGIIEDWKGIPYGG